ncbi:MAG: peptidyl-prolyl cis-trans isomerase, EpsD family [Betaproteobacteria bacterium]|nr:peptidyl-prolyl cis-trans isomerase, EpsD family [Betaproteobacteria bacterium]
MNFPHRFSVLSWVVLAMVLSTGCSDKKEGAAAKTASQVVAKVNGTELTVHQLNSLAGGISVSSKEQAEKLRSQILERLIDQEILLQKAVEEKLDRDPNVMQAMESARRDVLARAYLDKKVSRPEKPADSAIADYYARNPALFKDRRFYNVEEIQVANIDAQGLAALQESLAAARSFDDVAAKLKAQDVFFQRNAATRFAEQFPMELLPRVHALRDGQATVVRAGQGAYVVRVISSQPAPLVEAAARPVIGQMLMNTERAEKLKAEVTRLREQAKVEYTGTMPAPPAKGEAAAVPPARADDAANLERGLKGLK